MRKTEKETLQAFMNRFTELNNEEMKHFKALQSLSRENGLTVYCSAVSNFEQLYELAIETGNTSLKRDALTLYAAYENVCGKQELLNNYGSMLANIDFWK